MKKYALLATIALLLALAGAYFLAPASPDARRAELRKIDLPGNGAALYSTLLREIPEVVSQVPCACCGLMLSACYQGACPPT